MMYLLIIAVLSKSVLVTENNHLTNQTLYTYFDETNVLSAPNIKKK